MAAAATVSRNREFAVRTWPSARAARATRSRPSAVVTLREPEATGASTRRASTFLPCWKRMSPHSSAASPVGAAALAGATSAAAASKSPRSAASRARTADPAWSRSPRARARASAWSRWPWAIALADARRKATSAGILCLSRSGGLPAFRHARRGRHQDGSQQRGARRGHASRHAGQASDFDVHSDMATLTAIVSPVARNPAGGPAKPARRAAPACYPRERDCRIRRSPPDRRIASGKRTRGGGGIVRQGPRPWPDCA